MSALATPESSQVLLIDPLTDFLGQLDGDFAELTRTRFECLAKAANEARVPRIHAVSSEIGSDDQWLAKPCEKRTARVFRFERDRSVWSNPDLLEAMRQEDREQLFICGFWLDDVIDAVALEAQPFGFNTHVITDLSLAFDRTKRRACFDRLNQYGIAPILLQNLLYEWMAKTEDDDRRRELEALWQQQKLLDKGSASAARTRLS